MATSTTIGAKSGRFLGIATLSGALILTGMGPVFAADEPSTIEAVQDAAPEALTKVAQVTHGTDGTILQATVSGNSITIPDSSDEALTVKSSAPSSLQVKLPFASQSSSASLEAPGIASFDNNNGSITVPVIKNNGSLQVATVIQNANAPTSYEYEVTTSSGGSLVSAEGGRVVVLDGSGQPASLIEAPWAKDANGKTVPTSYEIKGSTLIQHVDLSDPNIAYPVVADPTYGFEWWGTTVKLTKSETKTLSNKLGNNAGAVALLCGFVPAAGVAVCAAAAAVKINSWVNTIKNAASQGRCAQINNPYLSGPYLWSVSNEKC